MKANVIPWRVLIESILMGIKFDRDTVRNAIIAQTRAAIAEQRTRIVLNNKSKTGSAATHLICHAELELRLKTSGHETLRSEPCRANLITRQRGQAEAGGRSAGTALQK